MFMTKHPRLFSLFKYTIYLALAINTLLFLQEDLSAMSTVFTDGFEWPLFIEAFSASIDTASWLVLLIVFELETFVIEDDVLEGWVGRALKIIGVICYLIIIYAFYGYVASLSLVNDFAPVAGKISDFCALVQTDTYEFVESLDDYVALNATNCQTLGPDSFINEKSGLISPVSHFDELTKLTCIDIINAGAWILVVLVLQLEIFFGKTKAIFKPIKISLYTILFMCLLAWFFYGGFLDIWDAALWLIAFFFIEMNVVAWREEIAERKRSEGVIS